MSFLRSKRGVALFVLGILSMTTYSMYKGALAATNFTNLISDNTKLAISPELLAGLYGRNRILASQQNVAVIGGGGNIGSYLSIYLKSQGYNVIAYDKDPNIPSLDIVKLHSRSLGRKELEQFDAVIFLGGCTGRRDCQNLSSDERHQENVQEAVDLVKKMSPNQLFLTASTSAVSEGRENAKESDPIREHLLDEYSISMYRRELALENLSKVSPESTPHIVLLRFGTVVGVSPGQRTDLLVPSLFKSAYTGGILRVEGYDKLRPFLWLHDLARSFDAILSHGGQMERFRVWNLASFKDAILRIATTVSSITGASLDVEGTLDVSNRSLTGFSLDCQAFERVFNFTFQGTLSSVITEFDKNIPDSITGKGFWENAGISSLNQDTILPCPVCGSTDQQVVLDLGDQPFANDFRNDTTQSLALPRFPLKLVRCRVCNHFHLSYVASREDLFVQYMYRSGTSTTLAVYFEWLAKKVVHESGGMTTIGSVLDIACNDGSFLDHFKQFGWKTFGVDPAENLGPIARAKGHKITTGFWSQDSESEEMPVRNELTAIVAQNVLAHVPDPVGFLKACAKAMGRKTKLYIQTSQCNMHQLGQFDTAYHEHVSFFTAHSFLKAADLSGLYITSFETTPIHGTSCLVTMELKKEEEISSAISPSMSSRLAEEVEDGITTDFFYERYAKRAFMIRDYLKNEIDMLKGRGYTVGAYGAAAKGMTLLHFILATEKNTKNEGDKALLLDFVLDDAAEKQNTYCPGTSIPVFSTDSVTDFDSDKPLAVIIFAWNFWDEIAAKLRAKLNGKRSEIVAILPFPSPRVVRLNLTDVSDNNEVTLRTMPYHPTSLPNVLPNGARNKTLLVSHLRNEEMLLPFFIIQHAPMFDHAVLIDFISTDESRAIIEKYAPPSWLLVKSSTGEVFDAEKTDQQVMFWEQRYPEAWAIALTTTEFLLYPRFRENLFELQLQKPGPQVIIKLLSLVMAGNDTIPLQHFTSLIKQRHEFVDMTYKTPYDRFLHLGTTTTHRYTPGRHSYKPAFPEHLTSKTIQDGLIFKWQWTPWPESVERKLGVGKTIPDSDTKRGRGRQHVSLKSHSDLYRRREMELAGSKSYDLCDDHGLDQFLWARSLFQSTIGPGVCS